MQGVQAPPLNSKAVFDDLEAGMDEAYLDLDNFFMRVGMDRLPCPGRQNCSRNIETQEIHVEFWIATQSHLTYVNQSARSRLPTKLAREILTCCSCRCVLFLVFAQVVVPLD